MPPLQCISFSFSNSISLHSGVLWMWYLGNIWCYISSKSFGETNVCGWNIWQSGGENFRQLQASNLVLLHCQIWAWAFLEIRRACSSDAQLMRESKVQNNTHLLPPSTQFNIINAHSFGILRVVFGYMITWLCFENQSDTRRYEVFARESFSAAVSIMKTPSRSTFIRRDL